jgi:hypothetical protein
VTNFGNAIAAYVEEAMGGEMQNPRSSEALQRHLACFASAHHSGVGNSIAYTLW